MVEHAPGLFDGDAGGILARQRLLQLYRVALVLLEVLPERPAASVVGARDVSGKKKPGTVSLEMFTRRGIPNRIAASRVLKTPLRLLWNTTCGGLCY